MVLFPAEVMSVCGARINYDQQNAFLQIRKSFFCQITLLGGMVHYCCMSRTAKSRYNVPALFLQDEFRNKRVKKKLQQVSLTSGCYLNTYKDCD